MPVSNEIDCKKLATDVADLVMKGLAVRLNDLNAKADKLAQAIAKHDSRIIMIEHEQQDMNEVKQSLSDLKETTTDINTRLTIVELNTNELVKLKNSVIRWIIGAFAVIIIALVALATMIPKLLGL